MSNRDEQLLALEAAVKSAESKLKSAEMTVKDVDGKIKSADEAFEQKLAEKAAGYKEQTGADFSRTVDENGRVTYSFSREKTEKERNKSRNLTIKRSFDSETGKVKHKIELTDNGSQTVAVNSAKDLKKPKNRKRYIAYNLFGYRKLELSTEVNNPFLNTVGKPIIVPIQTAARLAEKFKDTAAKVADSSVGRGVSDAAKIVSAPIVIPAKIVKDIADKGGVIHAVTDLGSKIKIEGYNVPKPLKTGLHAASSAAKGAETLTVGTAKGLKKFSVEIAKEQLYQKIHEGISENEGTQAAYVIGIRAVDVYKVLNEHAKFRKAVRRDKAGNDVKDVNVSRYLAEKEEAKFAKVQDRLEAERAAADYSADNARKEYEAAKKREEIANSISKKGAEKKDTEKNPSKIDKEIEKTKQKLRSAQKHKYKLSMKPVFDEKKGKIVTKPTVKRVEITGEKPMTALQTGKKLGGLAVRDTAMSMRRKAMRDGGDNAGVEAANFAITASQQTRRAAKTLNEKVRQFSERHYEQKLQKLNNAKKLEEQTVPKSKAYEKKSPDKKRKKKSGNQKHMQKKKIQRKVYNRKKKEREVFKSIVNDVKGFVFKQLKGAGIVIAGIMAVVLLPMLFLTMCGGGGGLASSGVFKSPLDLYDIGSIDLYYTELAKDMIDTHQNIESYYVDYDKYVCLTEISEISHSPAKLLPCVTADMEYPIVDEMTKDWLLDSAKSEVEEIFNAQYEFYTNEIHEVRKNVTTVTYSNEDSYYSAFGTSEYNLERPEGANIPNPLKSEYYTGYANTYTHVEVPIINGYIENTLDCIGVYTDENGQTTEYEDMQTMTFYNFWQITLVFDYMDDGEYQEYWKYTEQRQEYFEYDYYILEYAIRENNIEVPDSYWSDTDENWQDNNFNRLIYNIVSDMDGEEQAFFYGYLAFNMGRQIFKSPFLDAQIAKYPGYNTDIYGDMSLENSIIFYSSAGQEIVCGTDGEITVTDNGFSVYNKKYGTLYYEGATAPTAQTGTKGAVVSTATGDTLKVTYIDNDGNYVNPLFAFQN
ncbi:MAG: hypothetical protein NC485_10150 [Ruminococcus flavefaciens]|nr:hypothetical protein [Ruminococcus flavefaciens]MCM1059258.1 hypothetical protein [Eubacterium sp.]